MVASDNEELHTPQLAASPHESLKLRGAEVLAPMVRAGTLPMRLECLRYGADYVWGEEIIDKKLIGAVRLVNNAFNQIDYVSPREQIAVFSTCEEEKSRMIFQLGTASGPLAAEAAQLVCSDVRGIDVNMGCPKSFSVKGGMGAALLEKPEVVEDILKTLRRTLPSSNSLTCKIRMLSTTAKTRDFLQVCERSGAEAITVHMRQRDERPADPAHWDEIIKLWDAVKVPMLANGDFFTRRQIDEFWKHIRTSLGQPDKELATWSSEVPDAAEGPVGVMIARGALWNPSIFCRKREPPSFEEMVRSYVRSAAATNATYQNTKWVLSQIFAGGIGVTVPTSVQGMNTKLFNRQVSALKSMSAICAAVTEPFQADKYPERSHTTVFYRGVQLDTTAEAASAAKDNDAAGQKRKLPVPDSGDSASVATDVQESSVKRPCVGDDPPDIDQ
eukprot:TRINITY_DN77508_c0_g1_i1.p1 TRINITY_DN77508_c0_g1~~TRINITY_DN77508_c0_g1_i1.p1  ORF type:complete len:453 (+),score=78.76 TRINITY_DN77508_c0_g1_i1:28-1359(+)